MAAGHRHPEHDGEHDDVEVEAVDRLIEDVLAGRAEADGDPLRASLQRVQALSNEPLPRRRRRWLVAAPGPGGRPRLAPAALLALVIVLLSGTVAVAQDADPDDGLYGIKRASEQAWLAVPRGPERAAAAHLALAERRIGEARRAPDHAEQLIAEGLENVEAAAERGPEDAIETFLRLLGEGEDALPPTASPMARISIHRNCVRISEHHDFDAGRCGPAPEMEHPGARGLEQRGLDGGDGPPAWLFEDGAEGPPFGPPAFSPESGGEGGETPRGWGPGGRPDGVEGAPPGTPGHERGGGDD